LIPKSEAKDSGNEELVDVNPVPFYCFVCTVGHRAAMSMCAEILYFDFDLKINIMIL
jgi:hypothetical protein